MHTQGLQVVVTVLLVLSSKSALGQGQGYTGACASSQLGVSQNVYQNSGPVPKSSINGSLCTVPVTPFDQQFTSTCTALCCSSNAPVSSCTCDAAKSTFTTCPSILGSSQLTTIYCWVATPPQIIFQKETCCPNFALNTATGVCEAITTSTKTTTSTTTATTTTTATSTATMQTTTTPAVVLMMTQGGDPVLVVTEGSYTLPANLSAAPVPQADSTPLLQGPLMYGVIGAIVFLAIVILLVTAICLWCRRRQRSPNDLSGLEARVKAGDQKVKGKDKKVKVKSSSVKDDRKPSTSSQRELFYDIDDVTGEVYVVNPDAYTANQHQQPGHVVRAVTNDYVTLPEHGQGHGHGSTSSEQSTDSIYQTIP